MRVKTAPRGMVWLLPDTEYEARSLITYYVAIRQEKKVGEVISSETMDIPMAGYFSSRPCQFREEKEEEKVQDVLEGATKFFFNVNMAQVIKNTIETKLLAYFADMVNKHRLTSGWPADLPEYPKI